MAGDIPGHGVLDAAMMEAVRSIFDKIASGRVGARDPHPDADREARAELVEGTSEFLRGGTRFSLASPERPAPSWTVPADQAPGAALWASPVEETPNNEVKPWLLRFQPR